MDLLLDKIMSFTGVVAMIFTVYLYFRKPQEKSEVNDAVFDVKFQGLEKIVCNLRDNHVHTLEMKLDKHISDQQFSTESNIRQMTRIETLLEQLLSKK